MDLPWGHTAGFRQIAHALTGWRGSIQRFTDALDERGVPYLSYSKVACIDYCSYRYVLEYVERRRLRHQPTYFVKGAVFHSTVATLYRRLARKRQVDAASLRAFVERKTAGEDQVHLLNALHVAIENAMSDWEVVAVEKPFALWLGRGMPPCIGVIDLVLRQGDTVAVIDHKTGKRFNDLDELQLAIYAEHARREYRPRRCIAYYDEYRWVDDLARIRKPAFRRTPFEFPKGSWDAVLRRLRNARDIARRLERPDRFGQASADGNCWACPWREQCLRASTGFDGQW